VQEPPDQKVSSVRIVPAAHEQEPILANLLELYIHDFSEFQPIDLGPDGRFGYKSLPDYWSHPDHHPFLITVEDKLAGLALVKKERALSADDQVGGHSVWDMAEFFVVRGHRRRGVALAAAHQVWRLFPGPWQVRVMQSNRPALNFWQRAVDTFTGHPVNPVSIERDGKTWSVFTFNSSEAGND
jgi:predicted acetyltransferase